MNHRNVIFFCVDCQRVFNADEHVECRPVTVGEALDSVQARLFEEYDNG
jgi:hypothetical protein